MTEAEYKDGTNKYLRGRSWKVELHKKKKVDIKTVKRV